MQDENKKRRFSRIRNNINRIRQREEVKLANLFTTLNLLCGLTSIFFSLYGRFYYAGMIILASAAFDFFDGKLARKAEKATNFGREYDSSADLISFGVAPIVMAFMHSTTYAAIAAYFINMIAGAFRLSRYNILPVLPYFVGMPIPLNAMIIVSMIWTGVPQAIWPFIFILSAILMASPLKFPKR